MGKSLAPVSSGSSSSVQVPQTSLQDPSGGYGNAFLAQGLASQGNSKADAPFLEHVHGGEQRVGGPGGAPTTKAAALERHEKNVAKMDRILQSGLSLQVDPAAPQDNRLLLYRNSAEWIDQGKATLYVLSPTHDSARRTGVPSGQVAYFDNRVTYDGSGADYDHTTKDAAGNATNNAGITVEFASVVGTMSGDGAQLTIIDPLSKSEGFLVETLIHETQHDADQHQASAPWALTRPAPDPSVTEPAPATTWNSYQSEFRSYWIENPEGSGKDAFGSSTDTTVSPITITAITSPGADGTEQTADDTTATATTSFSNARQESIARHLGADERTAGDWYDYTNKSWRQSYAQYWYYYVVDPAFRAMVDSYALPVGGNLINSVRIQNLSDAIVKNDTAAMWTAVDALDAADLAYVSDPSASKSLWDSPAASLDLVDYLLLAAAIGIPSPPMVGPPAPQTVTVVKGDTLSALADRLLYDRTRWREIYRLNRSVIGPDPDRLEPGMVLELPRP